MPLSNGRCDSIVVQASRPPADAPIPTTGKTSGRVALSEDGEDACDFTAVFFGEFRGETEGRAALGFFRDMMLAPIRWRDASLF